jgi:hypothetical protein
MPFGGTLWRDDTTVRKTCDTRVFPANAVAGQPTGRLIGHTGQMHVAMYPSPGVMGRREIRLRPRAIALAVHQPLLTSTSVHEERCRLS